MASSFSAGSFGGFKSGEGESSFASEFETLLRERVDNIRPGKIDRKSTRLNSSH